MPVDRGEGTISLTRLVAVGLPLIARSALHGHGLARHSPATALEANFYPGHTPALQAICQQPIQVLCHCPTAEAHAEAHAAAWFVRATATPGIWITCPPTSTRQPSRGSRLALPGQSFASIPTARWTSRPWPHGSGQPDGTTAAPSPRLSAVDPHQFDNNTPQARPSSPNRICCPEDTAYLASVLVSDLWLRSTQDNGGVDDRDRPRPCRPGEALELEGDGLVWARRGGCWPPRASSAGSRATRSFPSSPWHWSRATADQPGLLDLSSAVGA